MLEQFMFSHVLNLQEKYLQKYCNILGTVEANKAILIVLMLKMILEKHFR